jgi:hypothetical protein
MQASDRQPNRPVTEAATLTERAAMLVEQDILAGHLAPGSRLGIVDLVLRYEIGATPLRDGLSGLMSRGLIVGTGRRGFSSPMSAADLPTSPPCAPRSGSRPSGWRSAAMTPGRPALSARCQMRRHPTHRR